MPSGNIETVTFKINLYTQWLSDYGYTQDKYATPSDNYKPTHPVAVSSQKSSDNINTVPEIIKLIYPLAISINASSGNINIVPEICTYTPISIPLKL